MNWKSTVVYSLFLICMILVVLVFIKPYNANFEEYEFCRDMGYDKVSEYSPSLGMIKCSSKFNGINYNKVFNVTESKFLFIIRNSDESEVKDE